jgi:hypothetical protein
MDALVTLLRRKVERPGLPPLIVGRVEPLREPWEVQAQLIRNQTLAPESSGTANCSLDKPQRSSDISPHE